MGATASDPIDHHRTTQRRDADTAKVPGLLLSRWPSVAFVVCLASFAVRQVNVGIGAAIVALLAAGARWPG